MNSAWLWLAVPLAPLLGAMLLVSARERAIAWLPLSVLPALALAAWPVSLLELPWIWQGVRWGAVDALARAWLGFSAVLWLGAGLFATSSLRADAHRLRFWGFWQLALAGNLLLIIAVDALSFYLGFSLMSLSAYGLVVHSGSPPARRAARFYLQLAIAAEMLLLAGLMLRTAQADGSFAFPVWQVAAVDAPTLLLLLLGLGLKAGFWPLHMWLPLAHPAAPPPASAVLSGAMLKAGVLGLWRCLPQADPLLDAWAPWLFAAGLFGALYMALLGLCGDRAKVVLAYSSASQMGWLLMIIALAWHSPAQHAGLGLVLLLFGVHHGLAKGSLFLAAGLVHETRLPAAAWLLLALPALALAGLPFSTGASAKLGLKELWKDSALAAWLPLLSLASVATALLLVRALWLLARDQRMAPRGAPPLAQWLPWALLGASGIGLPWWVPAFRSPLLEHLAPADLWSLSWPLLLAAGLAYPAVRLGWRVPATLRRLPERWLLLSLQLKRLVHQPPLRELEPHPDRPRWRTRERHWNRLWARGVVAASLWLLAGLLWLGLAW